MIDLYSQGIIAAEVYRTSRPLLAKPAPPKKKSHMRDNHALLTFIDSQVIDPLSSTDA